MGESPQEKDLEKTHDAYKRKRRCVVMHDAPSFLFITDINRFIFFKLR